MEYLWKLVESGLSNLIDKGMDFALSEQQKITFESLQSNIRSLCAKAADVKIDIREAELFGKKKRKREVDDWLEQIQTIENKFRMQEDELQTEGFIKTFFCGDRASKLEARVCQLVEQSRNLGELVRDACDIKGEILLTNGLVGEEFEKNLKIILSYLLVDNVPSVGVYGMGGVGKTTLAKHLNNRLQQQTQRVLWITVSQEFSITMLQDEIAKFVGHNLSDEHNEDKRASRLNKVLSERKNLVFILDDVWKEIDLKMLGDPLSLDECKLLITTRSEKVCYQMGCKRLIKVKTLKDNEAWNLFKETHGQVMNLSTEVQEIAKLMVEVCDGLPLGIITIAGSMKGETNFHVWRDAFAELKISVLGPTDMEEKVFKVLKYSFDQLGQGEEKKNGYSKLQCCFLYCSLYPEDYKMVQEDLIRKFILEEFLDKRESRKALISQGHTILEKLVNVCLLERVKVWHGGGVCDGVKMHDLVRAMALKINEVKTKVIVGDHSLKEIPVGEEWWAQDIEKIFFMENDMNIQDGISPNCPKLSTLLCQAKCLDFIPNSFFLQMPNLFVLDLSWSRIKKLPNSLSNLVSLKALLLQRCFLLEYVPYLGNMKELRELDLSHTKTTEIPQGMEKLSNLKFLSLRGTGWLNMLPECLLMKFLYLQCLHLPCHIQPPIEEIQELKLMEEFSGGVQGACDFNCLMKIWPSVAYKIGMGGSRSLIHMHHPKFGYHNNTIHHNYLEITSYDFGSRKDKDVTILAQDIQILRFSRCKGLSNCLLEDLRRLNNPTSVRELSLVYCDGIECLSKIEQFPNRGRMTSTSISISSPPPHDFFLSLRKLYIFWCDQIKRLGLQASQLQNLEELEICYCDMIEEIMEVSENIGGRGSGEASSVISFPRLKHLILLELPRLKSICSGTMICTSIEMIVLQRCQGLEKLPTVFGQPNYDSPPQPSTRVCLRKDEKEWWEKLELGHPSHHSLLKCFIEWNKVCAIEAECQNCKMFIISVLSPL